MPPHAIHYFQDREEGENLPPCLKISLTKTKVSLDFPFFKLRIKLSSSLSEKSMLSNFLQFSSRNIQRSGKIFIVQK